MSIEILNIFCLFYDTGRENNSHDVTAFCEIVAERQLHPVKEAAKCAFGGWRGLVSWRNTRLSIQ